MVLIDNLSSPISRLPPELLVKIFECLVTHSSPTIILRICHRWADVASSVSPLWSKIDFSTPPAPLLQRCISQPIDVILLSSPVVPTLDQRRAATYVLSHYNHCIRKLVLDLPGSHLRQIEAELSATFPILADVSISVKRGGMPFPSNLPEWEPAVSPPSPIRYLRIVGTLSVPWRFRNLVEFFLHDQTLVRFDPPMEAFIETLESSPQLAVLSVTNAGPRLPLHTTLLPPAGRVIYLPNLEHLYLEQEDACDVGWILAHLKIPISTKVRIHVDLEVGGEPTIPLGGVFDLILPNLPGFPHLTNLRRCTYAVDSRPACVIGAPNFTFCIIWSHPMRRHFDEFMMPFLRRAMAAGAIEDLTIIHHQPLEYSTSTLQWDKIFATLPSLRELRVEQSPGRWDFSILAVFQSQPSSALQDLRLSFLMFDKEPQAKGEGGNTKRMAGMLVDYCTERNQRGYRLKHLVIEAPSNPPPNLASSLAPYVDHLEIREEFFNEEDVWALELESRRVFNSLRAPANDLDLQKTSLGGCTRRSGQTS